MKKIFAVLISIVILSMCISVVAHGTESDDSPTATLPRYTIPQHSQAGDDSTSESGDDWEVTDLPFDTAVSLKECTVSVKKKKVYTGKKIRVLPTVKYKDTLLEKGRDYTLSYENNVKVGTARVIIIGKGNYSGTVKKTFNIIPKSTVISKLTSPAKGALKAVWKKQAVQTTGYQLQYSTRKSFKNKKTVNFAKAKITKKTVKKLRSGKKYYVRVRTYKKIGKKYYYSAWSKVENVKVK